MILLAIFSGMGKNLVRSKKISEIKLLSQTETDVPKIMAMEMIAINGNDAHA